MGTRLELQMLLEEITPRVYFQPPANIHLEYPCIIYNRDAAETSHADNSLYLRNQRYQVTIIDRDPDSLLPLEVAQLPHCSFDRFYTADNLNHDVYNLFY